MPSMYTTDTKHSRKAFNSNNGSPIETTGETQWISTNMPIPTYWPSFPIFPWCQAPSVIFGTSLVQEMLLHYDAVQRN